jgi:hypothetical protein
MERREIWHRCLRRFDNASVATNLLDNIPCSFERQSIDQVDLVQQYHVATLELAANGCSNLRIGEQHFNPCGIDQHDRGIKPQHRLDKSDLCDPPRVTDAAGFDNDVIEFFPRIEQAAERGL